MKIKISMFCTFFYEFNEKFTENSKTVKELDLFEPLRCGAEVTVDKRKPVEQIVI